MTQLEILAKESFERYAVRVVGHRSNWDYISKERKQAWMEEVITMSDYFIENFRNKISSKAKPARGQSGFENGMSSGILQERQDILNFLQQLDDKLKSDLEEFKNSDESR